MRFNASPVGAKRDMFACAATRTLFQVTTAQAIFGLADHAVMIFSVLLARSRQVQQTVYAFVLHVGKLLCGVVLVTARRTFPEDYVKAISNMAFPIASFLRVVVARRTFAEDSAHDI